MGVWVYENLIGSSRIELNLRQDDMTISFEFQSCFDVAYSLIHKCDYSEFKEWKENFSGLLTRNTAQWIWLAIWSQNACTSFGVVIY